MDKSNHLPYLQSQYFDRSLDPYFEHPLDAWTDAATEDEMGRQQEVVKKWEDKVMEYQRYGYANTLKWCQDSLAAAKVKLDRMKTGEDREFVKYKDKITAYEAAKIYLAKCVKLDEKFIVMARRDGNINEELFNDIMGIKKEEKK